MPDVAERPDIVEQFVAAARRTNPAAMALGFPPFTTGLKQETPLNSSPYLYRLDEAEAAFGSSERRRALAGALVRHIGELDELGVRAAFVLVGGSFLRHDREPRDLDGLLVYSLRADRDRTAALAALAERAVAPRDGVQLLFCPADGDPLVLVKRTIFFSNLFSFDHQAGVLNRGTVILVPSWTDATVDAAVMGDAAVTRGAAAA